MGLDAATPASALRVGPEQPLPPPVELVTEPPELKEVLLAALLVEFDPVLADEVRDHLEARADQWRQTADRPPSREKVETVRRYQALARLIRSRGPIRALPRS